MSPRARLEKLEADLRGPTGSRHAWQMSDASLLAIVATDPAAVRLLAEWSRPGRPNYRGRTETRAGQ